MIPAGDEPATQGRNDVVRFILTFMGVFKMARILEAFPRGIEMTILQFLSPCMFGHGDLLRTRDEEGHLALECADCGHVTRVLQEPAIKGPKHGAVAVAGAPLLKVKHLRLQERSFPRSA